MSDSYHHGMEDWHCSMIHSEHTVTNNNHDEFDDLDYYPRHDRLEALCNKHYAYYTH